MRYFNPAFTCHPPLFVGWNNNDKSSIITLSAGLLTASDIGTGNCGVRATLAIVTGKRYAEINLLNGGYAAGLANGAATFGTLAGSGAGGLMQYAGGNFYNNASIAGHNGNMSGGGILRLAYDADAHLGWLAFGPGPNFWNDDSGFDPGAGTGGLNTSAYDSSGLFPVWIASTNGQAATLNAGGSSFSYSLPTGFSAWNA